MRKLILIAVSVIASTLLATALALAQQNCVPFDESTERVTARASLTYDSLSLCENAAKSGDYTLKVSVTNSPGSTETVTINGLELLQTTPRPRGQSPDATASASGLPVTVAPGESVTFTASGTYELVQTDEGGKANLHLRASDQGVSSGLPFRLGINAHLRDRGAVEYRVVEQVEVEGPPAFVGGRRFVGPPSWVFGG